MNGLPLANGIIIDTATGQAIGPSIDASKTERLRKRETKSHVAGRDRVNIAIRIGIAELIAEPRALTTIGVVWMYYTLGLSDFDISTATGLTVDQVESIKGLSMFDTLQNTLTGNLTKLGEEDLNSRIAALAPQALDELEDIINDGEVEAAVRARVADSLLDRAGYAPKQMIEHKHKHEGGLIIKYVEDRTSDMKTLPNVQIDRHGAEDA